MNLQLLLKNQSLSDNSFLIVSPKTLVQVYDFDAKLHRNELDSTLILKGDSLINLTTKESRKVSIEGDSIVHHYHGQDTLFLISESGIFKEIQKVSFS